MPMHFRRFVAIFVLVLLGGVLAACGAEDDDSTPAATVAPTTAPVETEVVSTPEPTVAVTTPVASPVASPAATPIVATAISATEAATPILATAISATEVATPAVVVEAESTPLADEVARPLVVAEEPEPTLAPMVEIAGTLTLDGRAQQDYTLSDAGCVGLGEWRQLKPGAQVIVRDASGTVVDIAELEAHDTADACMWAFAIEVPPANYFSVSIPMITEVWFDQNDPAVTSGELELFVP